MDVIVVRHTLTYLNLMKKYSGQLDVPLIQQGVLQAQALSAILAEEKIDYAYSSDLARARQTMYIILGGRHCDVSQSSLLRELDVGVGAGEMRETILEKYRDERLDTRHPNCDFSSIGGESRKHVLARYHHFFKCLRDEKCRPIYGCHPDPDPPKNVTGLVVVHGTAWRYYSEANPKLANVPKLEQGQFLKLDLDDLV